jgi:uncharacterized protein
VAAGTDQLLLAGAGLIAGAAGSAGGITSLISYPALLAVGIPPLSANVTQAVSFAACLPGSALGSRPELRGQGPFLRRWGPVVVAGSAVGVTLLLLTPNHVFGRIVPFLLVLASVTLLTQPMIASWQDRNPGRTHRLWLPLGIFAIGVYSGYFGAGSGVMVLALLLLTVDRNLTRTNALKNILLGLGDAVAAIGFTLFGPVRWWAAWPLAIGLLLGSIAGPSVTRRVPGAALRVTAALIGLGLAIRLWVVPIQ